jgi:hypothetical protein
MDHSSPSLFFPPSQVYWTREVTEAIQTGGKKGLEQYGAKCTEQLNKIVGLVRGQLTSLERSTCGALVVIDVHARDVVVSGCKCVIGRARGRGRGDCVCGRVHESIMREKRPCVRVCASPTSHPTKSLPLLSSDPTRTLLLSRWIWPSRAWRTFETSTGRVSCGTTGTSTRRLPRASPPRWV